MNFAGSTIWLAEAGLDPGGIIGGLLCLLVVVFTAFMTSRAGRQPRRPAGTPIYRRNSPYRRQSRQNRDSDWADSGDYNSGDSGGGCGGGGGGGD